LVVVVVDAGTEVVVDATAVVGALGADSGAAVAEMEGGTAAEPEQAVISKTVATSNRVRIWRP
jgi:hypothetical protein